jgi:hypothetical protein
VLFVLRSLRSPDAAKWPPILRKPLPTNRGQHRPNPPNLTQRRNLGEAAVEVAEPAEVIDIRLAPSHPPQAQGCPGNGSGVLCLDRRARVGTDQRGRKVGKAIASRIDGLSVSSITKRSMPMPSPPHGGSPYSRAVT